MSAVTRRDEAKAKREDRFGPESSASTEDQKAKKQKSENEIAAGETNQNSPKKSAAGFDQEEADPWNQNEEEELVDMSFPEEFEDTFNIPRRTRLRVKTHPSMAPAYPSRKLLRLQEYRIRRFNLKQAKAKIDIQVKKVRMEAIELMARQPPAGAFEEDEWTAEKPTIHPHASHRITALHGNSDTIFCKWCGYWSARANLKLLAKPCQGLKEGSRSTLRLLECGVRPGPEALIPSHLKKRHGRKGRRKSRW